MIDAFPTSRFPSVGAKLVLPVNRVAERVRHYFDQHPEVAREKFLLEALRREVDFREQGELENEARFAPRVGDESNRWSTARPRPSAADIRVHAWLTERVAAVHYERHGLWPKLRRFLFGNRLVRWLGYSLSGAELSKNDGGSR
jgi:hypothetical protein